MEKLEFEVTPDGVIRGIYSDEKHHIFNQIAQESNSKLIVKRASNVEWEELPNGSKGWTVRAAWNRFLAVRVKDFTMVKDFTLSNPRDWLEVSVNLDLDIVAFDEREIALEVERDFFYDLLPKENK